MRHIKKFNESIENGKKLRDVIGEITETKEYDWRKISKTDKGCIINLNSELLDYTVSSFDIHSDGSGDIVLKKEGEKYGSLYYAYFENEVPKVISHIPGDEMGCTIFGDVFIASGHDGSYLFNIKTGEFKDHVM
jgi:hypothetical protein